MIKLGFQIVRAWQLGFSVMLTDAHRDDGQKGFMLEIAVPFFTVMIIIYREREY